MKVAPGPSMFLQNYTDDRESKYYNKIEWRYKPGEKIFIHCCYSWVFENVYNFEQNHFSHDQLAVHVSAPKAKPKNWPQDFI